VKKKEFIIDWNENFEDIHILVQKLAFALLASQTSVLPASAMCIHMTCFGNG